MIRLRNLQVDVPGPDHDVALTWWAAALGGRPRSTDEPEYTHLDGVRATTGVHVQRLVDGPAGMHLDLETDGDVDAEVARLRGLGAADVGALPGGEAGRILADPAGLPFCVTDAGQQQHLDTATSPSRLYAVVLDVPAEVAAAEAAFWAAASGGQVVPPHAEFPAFTAVRGLEGAGGPVGLLVQAIADGPPRVHVDLVVPDAGVRDTEAARLVDLGAAVEASHDWVVLRTPGGLPVCVVAIPTDP